MSVVLNSLLRLSAFVHRRKELWNVRTFQIPVVPYLHDMDSRRISACQLCTTVACQAGKHKNTVKKLVSIQICFRPSIHSSLLISFSLKVHSPSIIHKTSFYQSPNHIVFIVWYF